MDYSRKLVILTLLFVNLWWCRCIKFDCFNNNMLTKYSLPENSVWKCAANCLQSPNCGWILWNKESKLCLIKEAISSTDLSSLQQEDFNRILLLYRRIPDGISLEVMNAADATDMTSMKSCDTPTELANAVVEYDALFPGSTARYICLDGFSFCGPVQKEVTCLVNGSWVVQSTGCSQVTWYAPPASALPVSCPIRAGTVVEIIGIPTKNTIINLDLIGDLLKIVLVVAVRFTTNSYHVVLCSGRTSDGVWMENEDRADRFPFEVGKRFNITLVVETLHYDVIVDGQHLMFCRHRYPIEDIRAFEYLYDVQLLSVKFIYNTT